MKSPNLHSIRIFQLSVPYPLDGQENHWLAPGGDSSSDNAYEVVPYSPGPGTVGTGASSGSGSVACKLHCMAHFSVAYLTTL